MMLCLALRSDAQRVYRRALRYFSVEEITEGFAAARGLALPSQLRRMMRAQGRDLHAEFVQLLPRPPRPISIQRWTARRLLLLGATAVVLVLAYEVVIGGRADPLPRQGDIYARSLSCTDAQPLWLLAQSVRSSSRVVCVQSLPAGWTLGHVTVANGESVLTFDHDRAGSGALVARLSGGCAPNGADEIASDQPGVRSYQRVTTSADRSTIDRFDVFAGGCLTTRLLAPSDQQFRLTADLPRLLGFTERRTLDKVLEQRSHGRLELDPPG
jgi:hypothetical protein